MGNSFTLRQTVKTFDVKNEEGEVLKSFSVDVGNFETLEKWSADISRVEELQARVQEDGTMEALRAFEEEIISRMLGADAWAWLWDVTNHNIVAIVRFLSDFQGFLNEQQAASLKGYI